MAAQCDIFGNSVGSEPLSAAITLSAAPDKMVINSEIHAMGGSTYERPAPLSLEDVKRHVYLPLSLGIKGFLFWQYRPERLGLESPAWGLTDLEGNMTPWLEAAVKVNAALQENAAVILNASRPRAQVAVLNSKRSQLFDFCVDHRRQMYVYSVKGAYAMSRSRGYATDVVGEAQMTPAFLARYSVLYDPFPYYKDAKTCAVLRQWVENGGTLVAECCFGGYSDDDGLHTTRQPGFGFDKVFGAVEGQATTASHFQNAYGEEWPQAGAAADVVDIVARGAALGAPADETYKGCCFYQSIRPTSANCAVIATFRDGAAAAVCAQYGRGRAIWLGSLVALAYERLGKVENARFLDRLIASFSPVRPEFATSDDRVVCAALSAPEGCLLAVDNQSSRADVAISCDRARLNGAVLKNILGGDAFPIVTVAGDAGGQGSRARVDLAIRPGGIEVFKVCQ
ncbi:MAG: beta-galactosidase trimerization domain-containing protein [Planctomycetes bacterium]|nr:beta-galactosidase trimerization domain-containing protein [Planctomycetota bacterium]